MFSDPIKPKRRPLYIAEIYLEYINWIVCWCETFLAEAVGEDFSVFGYCRTNNFLSLLSEFTQLRHGKYTLGYLEVGSFAFS